MTRLAAISDDLHLAKRSLRLYVQIVSKAYQTNSAGHVGATSGSGSNSKSASSVSVTGAPTSPEPPANSIGAEEVEEEADGKDGEPMPYVSNPDHEDDDRTWVETIVFGVRMVCREVSQLMSLGLSPPASSTSTASMSSYAIMGGGGPTTEAKRDLEEVGRYIPLARGRLDDRDRVLNARVDLAEGIWLGTCALYLGSVEGVGKGVESREELLEKSHEMITRAHEGDPTAESAYYLALSYTRPRPASLASASAPPSDGPPRPAAPNANAHEHYRHRQDLDLALKYATAAVESSPHEIPFWHLLGLVLGMREEWSAAVGAVEMGCAVGEPEPEPEPEPEQELPDEGEEEEEGMLRVPDGKINGNGNGNGTAKKIDGLPNGGGSSSSRSSSASPTPTPETPPPPPPPPRQPVYILPPSAISTSTTSTRPPKIPSASTLLLPLPDHPPPSTHVLFEQGLQIRMTLLALVEKVEGEEGASERMRDVFAWVAERRGYKSGVGGGANTGLAGEGETGSLSVGGGGRSTNASPSGGGRTSTDASGMKLKSPSELELKQHHGGGSDRPSHSRKHSLTLTNVPTRHSHDSDLPPPPIQIGLVPATPTAHAHAVEESSAKSSMFTITPATAHTTGAGTGMGAGTGSMLSPIDEKSPGSMGPSATPMSSTLLDVSSTSPRDREKHNPGKKMQTLLKHQVHKSGARISTIRKRIESVGHGGGGGGGNGNRRPIGIRRGSGGPNRRMSAGSGFAVGGLRRSSSTPGKLLYSKLITLVLFTDYGVVLPQTSTQFSEQPPTRPPQSTPVATTVEPLGDSCVLKNLFRPEKSLRLLLYRLFLLGIL
jgi:hypothetical protein